MDKWSQIYKNEGKDYTGTTIYLNLTKIYGKLKESLDSHLEGVNLQSVIMIKGS
jgi:hypothetical protein